MTPLLAYTSSPSAVRVDGPPPSGVLRRSSFIGGDVDSPQRRNSVVQREQTEQTREERVVLERRNSLMSVAL